MAFSHMQDPTSWFAFIALFFVVAAALYIYDFFLIKKHRPEFVKDDEKRQLYEHIEKRQLYESRLVLPAGFIFNLAIFAFFYYYPSLIAYHLIFIVLQVFFSVYALYDFQQSFKTRTTLITALARSEREST